MSRTIVVLSTLVDVTIREQLPGDKIQIFNSIEDLSAYTNTTPIRADVMYMTRDVLGVAVNTKLAFLMDLLMNPFMNVSEIIYTTEVNSPELVSINFMIEENSFKNWIIQYGSLNREYLTNLIAGTLRSEEISPRRKSVVRKRRDEYLKERLSAGDSEAKFEVEEDDLRDIPYEQTPDPMILEVESVCKLHTVSGLESKARSIFTILFSQYLSFTGKTLVIERDLDYLRLTDMFYKSGVSFHKVEMSELYDDPEVFFRTVRQVDENIILLTDTTREGYDYAFVGNLVYNNLKGDLSHLVLEKPFAELSPTTHFVTVLENDIASILKAVEAIPAVSKDQTRYAVLNVDSFNELRIPNTKQLKGILSDLLQDTAIEVLNFNVRSLKLGGEAHDLRMYNW